MQGKLLILAVAGVLYAGCATPAAQVPPVVVPPAVAPPTVVPPTVVPPTVAPAPEPEPFDLAPAGELSDVFTRDQPVYSADDRPGDHGAGFRQVPGPDESLASIDDRVARLIAHLRADGQPAQVPEGVAAAYVATLADGVHVYNFGGPAGRPHGGDRDKVYRIERRGAEWQAVRVCEDHSDVVGVWEVPGAKVLLACAKQVVLGTARDYWRFYLGREQVLMLDQLPGEENLEFLGPGPGGMPRLRLSARVGLFPGQDARGPAATERLTLAWQDSQYEVTHREWLADRMYYYARFAAFVKRGDYGAAAKQLAFTPEGGVESYLRSHASDLKRLAEQGDVRPQFNGDRMELRGSTGALWYTFGPDGRITGIGQEGVQ